MNNAALAIRVRKDNPNHHLWDNNGTWFIHYTVHQSDFTKSRVRESLGTKSLAAARRLRNRILHINTSVSSPMQPRHRVPSHRRMS